MAMAEPNVVKLKRKRTDEPVDYLLLQGAGELPNKKRYVRREKDNNDSRTSAEAERPLGNDSASQSAWNISKQSTEKRVFELQRKPVAASRKRADTEEDIATFVEKKQRNHHIPATTIKQKASAEDSELLRPLKRPGQGSSLRTATKPTPQVETDIERKQMEALAAYMHSAALSELSAKPSTKPAPVSMPTLSSARSQALHRQRAATNGSISAMDLDDEDSYVYDTYILAPTTDLGAVQADELGTGSVGYLVITEDDRSLWETYLEEDGSEGDWDSEEDDENAENYYGAEYPEEEEEFVEGEMWQRFVVGRTGAPADEEWDDYTGMYSDEEDVVKNGEVPRRFRHLEMGLSNI